MTTAPAINPSLGYRLLMRGKALRCTDEYSTDGGATWRLVRVPGTWTPETHYPTRRKLPDCHAQK